VIEVASLSKRYGDHLAVQDLSFRIEPGQVVGLLGANGAGKTTTLRMLTGALPPTAGTVKIASIDIFEQPMQAKRRIGYLPETPPVYRDMTIREYLRFVADLKDVPARKTADEVARVADWTGLDHVLTRLIRNLSKGYRQRVGLAQALLSNPTVLILDEPTSGLDPVQVEQVRQLIRRLTEAAQHTILLSTHILSEVRSVCERVIMLRNGRIVADSPIAALEREHQGSLEEVFVRLALA
jgi:ABC-2 type transport system ATP-binding protein